MANEDTNSTEAVSDATPAGAWWKSPTQVPRRLLAWAVINRRQAALLVLGCLLSVGASVTAWLLLAKPRPPVEKPTLEPALQALDRRAYDEARRLAKKYREAAGDDRSGGVDFVLGAAAAYEADASMSEVKPTHFLAAARQLEQSRDHGFPAGRDAEGLYLLGKSLFCAGQLAACRPALREGLKLNPAHDAEIRYLLAEAYLIDAKPNPPLAEEENRLALTDRTDDAWHAKLLVQRARIRLAQGQRAEALRILDALPASAKESGEALLVRGQVQILEAESAGSNTELARQKYQQAIQTLRLAQGAGTLGSDVTRKAMYLVSICLLRSGDPITATAQFQRTARLYPNTAEAADCAFQEAELLRKAGSRDALGLYGKVLRWADAENYVSPWVALQPLQDQMLAVFQDYLQRQDFPAARELARGISPLFPTWRSAELQAETEMAWGRSLQAKAESNLENAESLRRDARSHFRLAGGHYAELARLLTTNRRYTEELWNSAQAYLDGYDYQHGAEMLELYLKHETRRRNAQAMTAMGEALLAQGKLDPALKVLTTCVELHPHDTAAFRARLDAAKVYVEKLEPARAEALLRENLQAELLTPASAEWRESLFDLASLLFDERRYDEAISRLDEAADRYPQASRSIESRYLAADACRLRGLQIHQGLSRIQVESTRIEQARQANEYLLSALDRLEQLTQTLARKSPAAMSRSDSLVLRNTYFAIGEVLFALGRYEESATAYGTVARRYPDDPDSLEAYVQMAAAYRRLNRTREAQGAAEQAKVMLHRLKSDAALAESTTRNRKQWTELLNAISANSP